MSYRVGNTKFREAMRSQETPTRIHQALTQDIHKSPMAPRGAGGATLKGVGLAGAPETFRMTTFTAPFRAINGVGRIVFGTVIAG